MHYHLEVIMPPTADIDGALTKILAPFDEHDSENTCSFWDYWVIGGRYSGSKLVSRLPPDTLKAFNQWLVDEKITVSGLQWGKQELSPPSQIGKVDAKWKEMFGVETPCTLFKHSNAMSETLDGDICPLGEAMHVNAWRVIIAGPDYNGRITASYMIEQEYWNGVNFTKSTWDGKLASAVTLYEQKISHYTEEYRASHMPQSDWLTVTVDYHS